MKHKYKYTALLLLISGALVNPFHANAGNGDRVAQAGATDLLVNGWAQSSGWGSVNVASITGVESAFINIAGTAFTKKTEFVFARTSLFKGADISMNSFGLVQHVGESGAIGLTLASTSLGNFDYTTTDNPEGNLGTFSPQATNIGLSYAKEFSHSIYGGINVKAISESTPNLSAQGVAFDAGIQYVTGKTDNIHFGVALKNVGPALSFSGDGLTAKVKTVTTGYDLTIANRAEQFELPSLLNIGLAYDFKIDDNNKVTAAGSFVSNSFTNDQYIVGLEYGFRTYLHLRAGYNYVQNDRITGTATSPISPVSAGFSIQIPFGKAGSSFAIDYSYRPVVNIGDIQSIGARLTL
jgi:hypothetical protein